MDTEKLQERVCEMLALHFDINELDALKEWTWADWQDIVLGATDLLQDGDIPGDFAGHQFHDVG